MLSSYSFLTVYSITCTSFEVCFNFKSCLLCNPLYLILEFSSAGVHAKPTLEK